MLDYFKLQFLYSHWANNEINKALSALAAPPEKAVRITSHVYAAQWLWLSRLGEDAPQLAVWPDLEVSSYPDHNDRGLQTWKKYLDRIMISDLDLSISYSNSKGEEFVNTPRDIITQVLLHSAYHRGQVNSILRESGCEPPLTDYIHYIRSVR